MHGFADRKHLSYHNMFIVIVAAKLEVSELLEAGCEVELLAVLSVQSSPIKVPQSQSALPDAKRL